MGKLLLFLMLLPLSWLMLFCLAAWLSRKVRGCSVWTLPRGALAVLAVLALVAIDFAQKSLPVPPSLMPPPLPMGAGSGVTNIWEWIGEVDVPFGATNLTFTAEAADLPGAPADSRAWNVCAIVKGQKYVYFKRLLRRIPIKREVNKEDW